MSVVELVIAAAFAGLGVRSLRYWIRQPVALDATKHRVLFAVFVTARSGIWFSIAGLFVFYGTRGTIGRAFVDDVTPYRWLAVVPLVLAVVALAASALLAIGEDPESLDGP